MSGPLVEQDHDSTTWCTGFDLVRDAYKVSSGVDHDSWVRGSLLGAAAATLDTLSVVFDPLGSTATWDGSWLPEHGLPLRKALDRLAGNAEKVAAHAATWRHVDEHLSTAGDDYRSRLTTDVDA